MSGEWCQHKGFAIANHSAIVNSLRIAHVLHIHKNFVHVFLAKSRCPPNDLPNAHNSWLSRHPRIGYEKSAQSFLA